MKTKRCTLLIVSWDTLLLGSAPLFFLLARVQSDDLVVGHALQQKLGLGGRERVMEKL
jgi:hypothetical protein